MKFNLQSYKMLVNEAKKNNYLISSFEKSNDVQSQRKMVLRHDIDIAIEPALKLAQVEYDLGVTSTYFFMPTNDFYNLSCLRSRQQLKDILLMGHEIGLHFDSRLYPTGSAEMLKAFTDEKHYLESIIERQVISSSQHNPLISPIENIDSVIKINAYSKEVNNIYTYVSDSSMKWRKYTPLDLVNKGVNIQFCSHPVYWIMKGATADQKILAASKKVISDIKSEYTIFLEIMNGILDKRDEYDRAFVAKMKGIGNDSF